MLSLYRRCLMPQSPQLLNLLAQFRQAEPLIEDDVVGQSPAGFALRRRVPHIPVVLVPALVQGAQAPASSGPAPCRSG